MLKHHAVKKYTGKEVKVHALYE